MSEKSINTFFSAHSSVSIFFQEIVTNWYMVTNQYTYPTLEISVVDVFFLFSFVKAVKSFSKMKKRKYFTFLRGFYFFFPLLLLFFPFFTINVRSYNFSVALKNDKIRRIMHWNLLSSLLVEPLSFLSNFFFLYHFWPPLTFSCCFKKKVRERAEKKLKYTKWKYNRRREQEGGRFESKPERMNRHLKCTHYSP